MFEITTPSDQDADRIAAIHVAAMDSNPLLHVQFPTPEALAKLHGSLAALTVSQLHSPTRSGVLVARDSASGKLVSFAKWDFPETPNTQEAEVEDTDWPEGSALQYLDGYTALAEEAKKRVLGEKMCYRELESTKHLKSTCPSAPLFLPIYCLRHH